MPAASRRSTTYEFAHHLYAFNIATRLEWVAGPSFQLLLTLDLSFRYGRCSYWDTSIRALGYHCTIRVLSSRSIIYPSALLGFAVLNKDSRIHLE
jgi:hypothetical protein